MSITSQGIIFTLRHERYFEPASNPVGISNVTKHSCNAKRLVYNIPYRRELGLFSEKVRLSTA